MEEMLIKLWFEHSDWSQSVFGNDTIRGPEGPLKHLAKEVPEALEAYMKVGNVNRITIAFDALDEYNKELADIGLLFFDIIRRSGLSPLDIFKLMYAKLQENKKREWPKFDETKLNDAVEHVRMSTEGNNSFNVGE